MQVQSDDSGAGSVRTEGSEKWGTGCVTVFMKSQGFSICSLLIDSSSLSHSLAASRHWIFKMVTWGSADKIDNSVP